MNRFTWTPGDVAIVTPTKGLKYNPDQLREPAGTPMRRQGAQRKATAQQTIIDRIAKRLEPQLRKRFLAAVQATKDRVDLEALARAIQAGNLTHAEFAAKLSEWPEKYGELAIDLRAGFLAGGDVAYDRLDGAKYRLRFDLINPYAVNYAHRKLPQIVEEYKRNAREIIRGIITEAVSGNYTVQTAAQEIREHLGLTKRFSDAVINRRAELIGQGITGERLEAKVERYREKLLKSRAKTIARTEIIQAQVAGQRALWNEAAKEGLFNKQTAKRIWRTHEDERTCELCMAMDNQEIPFNGVYDHPELGQVNIFGEILNAPPMHPNCLVSYGTPVYTVEGWKRIVDIKVGDLVLTHMGRFRKVIQLHRNIGTENTVILRLHNSRHNLPLTKNHPVLTSKNRWVQVGDLRKGDSVRMLSLPCAYCGKPCLGQYCNNSCATRGAKKWIKANEGCRRRVQDGIFILQKPETKVAANRKLAMNSRSGSWLERKFGWAMNELGLQPVRCHPIPKTMRDAWGRQRYWFTDFAFPDLRLAVECDGTAWHQDTERDQMRQADIESQGWTVMRFPEAKLKNGLMECAQEVARLATNHAHGYTFGSFAVVSVIEVKRKNKYTTFNLSVEEDESFIANNVVVHNCRCGEDLLT